MLSTFCAKALRVVLPIWCIFVCLSSASAQTSRNVSNDNQVTRALSQVPTIGTRGGAPVSSNVAQNGAHKIALIIGNSNYQHLPALPNPKNDAEDMCKTVRTLGFEVHCHIDVATRSQFRQLVRNFSTSVTPQSTVLFYYAGHGVQINGENFLLPLSLDAKTIADIEDEALSLSFLLRTLEESRSLPNIVILDACRSNPFGKRFSGISKGLARVEPPGGTVLVYATSPNGVALDGEGRNGLFTKHLLENLSKPGRKLDELFQIVAQGVEVEARTAYKFDQTPFRSSSFSGGYCLAGCDNPEIAQQIDRYKKEGEEAAMRLQVLRDENTLLKKQFDERHTYVQSLETKIGSLASANSASGNQSTQSLKELAKLKSELALARSQQDATEDLKKAVLAREREISALRARTADSDKKVRDLETYRAKVTELEQENAAQAQIVQQLGTIQKQSEEAARRIQLLTDENKRLQSLADERRTNVLELERKFADAARTAAASPARTDQKKEELSGLTQALAIARKEQREADQAKTDVAGRDKEISALRGQLAAFESKANQLEEYRRQIDVLQSQNAEKSRLLSQGNAPSKPQQQMVIPSF